MEQRIDRNQTTVYPFSHCFSHNGDDRTRVFVLLVSQMRVVVECERGFPRVRVRWHIQVRIMTRDRRLVRQFHQPTGMPETAPPRYFGFDDVTCGGIVGLRQMRHGMLHRDGPTQVGILCGAQAKKNRSQDDPIARTAGKNRELQGCMGGGHTV